MREINKQLKSEKGASIIETLVALGFIAFVSASFISLAINARKRSFQYRVQNELGRYAGMIAEEVVKDYTISSVGDSGYYCDAGSEIGNLVSTFLITFDSSTCTVAGTSGNYTITLSVESFGKLLTAERGVILQ